MEQKNNFAEGSVAKNIVRMAVPMTVAQILNLLYNLVDRIYIGHIPGADSLALTGVAEEKKDKHRRLCKILFGCCFLQE